MNAENGAVYFEKDPDRKMGPASTTKLMTALVALELRDADSVISVPKEAGGEKRGRDRHQPRPAERIRSGRAAQKRIFRENAGAHRRNAGAGRRGGEGVGGAGTQGNLIRHAAARRDTFPRGEGF